MATAKKVSTEFFNLQVIMAWLAFNQEFGNTPQDMVRLERCKQHTGELVFDELQKKMNIPTGAPFPVAKAIGDFLTESGYAKYKVHKVSDTEIMFDRADMVMDPMVRNPLIKVLPAPGDTLFLAAFRKLCNMKVEQIPLPESLRASIPQGMLRKLWRLSPIK
ncbi:MAG: hypothetical protein HY529_04425 [Chloroflexi bacterium]|nr:hypothetical protein [Chloroflexota bacterium]